MLGAIAIGAQILSLAVWSDMTCIQNSLLKRTSVDKHSDSLRELPGLWQSALASCVNPSVIPLYQLSGKNSHKHRLSVLGILHPGGLSFPEQDLSQDGAALHTAMQQG